MIVGDETTNGTSRLFVSSESPNIAYRPALAISYNLPPTNASAGGPYTIDAGNNLALNGSATDPDGDTLSYSWDVNGDGSYGDATSVNPTLTWSQLNALGIDAVGAINNVSVQVSDGNGPAITSSPTTLTINPALSIGTQPAITATIDNGQGMTLSVTAANGTPAYTYQWYIGTSGDTTTPISGATSSSYVAAPTSTTSYWVKIADSTGASANSSTAIITVNHVNPTLALSGAASVNEGSTYTLNLSGTEIGTDSIGSWTINWGDGSGLQILAGNPSAVSHVYAEGPNDYTVSATATDDFGTYAANNTVAVTVNHVAPMLSISGAASVDEGAIYTLNLSGSDKHSISNWTINWGDDSTPQTVTGNPSSVNHVYAEGPNQYTIRASVTDDVGTYDASNTVGLIVNHVAPALSISGPASVNKGANYVLTLAATVTGDHSIQQWTINWGDGTSAQVVTGNPSSVTHVFAKGPQNYTISARATDDVGTFNASNTVAVSVTSQARPTLSIAGAATVNETATYTLTLAGAPVAGHPIAQWTINWGDASAPQTVNGNPSSVTHVFVHGPQSNTISATATDDLGTYAASKSVTVAVQHIAPKLTLSGSASVNEGARYTLHLSSSDPGKDTVSKWTIIAWGDGSPAQTVTGNPSTVTHVYAVGPNTYTVMAAATDEDGTYPVGNTVTVQVLHATPTLKISGAATVNEGAIYTLNLTSGDTHPVSQWSINWGDGTAPQIVNGNPPSVTHVFVHGPQSNTISATATDNFGTYAAVNTVSVAVTHVAPKLTISGAASVDEGTSYTLNLSSVVTADHAINKWTINWGDGTAAQTVAGNPSSVTHVFSQGSKQYSISATATDDVATFNAGNTVSVMVNHAATLTISGASTTNEGSIYTLNLSSNDSLPISKWSINWGDGSSSQLLGNPTSVTHVFADGPQNYTISASATDVAGTFGANVLPVTVNNVPPTLTLSGAATVNAGATYALNLSSTDPGRDTITQWTISWGDGTAPQTVSGNPRSVTHVFAAGFSQGTISASARDEDGTYAASNTVAVTVIGSGPTLSISGPSIATQGTEYSLNLLATGPGSDTIIFWVINWGDGTAPETVGGNPLSAPHVYNVSSVTATISAKATTPSGTFSATNTVTLFVQP